MKKLILFFLLLATMPALAQSELKFGYLSYNAVMQAMPEYAAMQNSMAELRQKYEAEQKRVEDDFNKKYEEFLDGQKSYPKTILQKRQSELQEMLDKNIAFKKESQRLLKQAERMLWHLLWSVWQKHLMPSARCVAMPSSLISTRKWLSG